MPHTKTLITPLNSMNSHTAKLAYPVYNIIQTSNITESVKKRNFLNNNVVNNPKFY